MLRSEKNNRYCKKAWTDHETQVLRQKYPNTSVEEIAEILNRTPSAVQARACKLSLKKEEGKDIWTEEDILLLKTIYPNATNCVLAERFGRSSDSIASIAKRLKLKKAYRWTTIELEYIRDNYSEKGRHYIAQELGRSPDSIKNAARQLGVARKTLRRCWTNEETEQLQQLLLKHTCDEIALLVNRPVNSVKMKKWDMKRKARDLST